MWSRSKLTNDVLFILLGAIIAGSRCMQDLPFSKSGTVRKKNGQRPVVTFFGLRGIDHRLFLRRLAPCSSRQQLHAMARTSCRELGLQKFSSSG